MNTTHIAGAAIAALLASAAVGSAQSASDGLRHAMIDADTERTLTKAETATVSDALFAELDRDRDGYLRSTDRAAGARADDRRESDVIVEWRKFGHGGPTGPGRPSHPPHPAIGVFVFASLEESDLNGDGKISRDEFRSLYLRVFVAADIDGSGTIPAPPQPPVPPEPPTPPVPPAAPR